MPGERGITVACSQASWVHAMKPLRPLPAIALILLLAGAMPAWCQTDVNTATEAQLDMVLGLGPATTRRILAERERAPFRNWSDLMKRIKGIGPASALKLSAGGLQVNGQSFEPAGQAPTTP